MKKFQPVGIERVTLDGGFLRHRQQLNEQVTIYAVRDRFRDTGRFDAFRCDWKPDMPHKPHYFWDSDIAKWLEAVAYMLKKAPHPDLEATVDEVVDEIVKNQGDDGYFNIYFQVIEPDKRWSNRDWHELYCAGHLMEAAVAYYEATGKDAFLKAMCRYADYIEKVFVTDHTASFYTPGHEEIELALVKLYRCTGEKRYLELSKFFVEERGRHEEDLVMYTWHNGRYGQTHVPVREQTTAEGHAVRAVYLYSGMADLAYEYNDDSLLAACETLFDNMAERRMYITGGIGSTARCEGFTIDYDLPNLTAYSESCAAIGLAFFAHRMLLLDVDAKYADTIERILYNGFLSNQSLDGKSFFYENPLEIDPKLVTREKFANQSTRMPATQRREVFDCSCCPPNINRFWASLGEYLYTADENTVYVHQYTSSSATFDVAGCAVTLRQETAYPHDGAVRLTVQGLSGKKLAVRIPGWCRDWSLALEGATVTAVPVKGYVYLDIPDDTTTVALDMAMPATLYECHPYVQDNAGRVAVQRGPILYCIEGVDNGDNLRDIAVSTTDFEAVPVFSDWCRAHLLKAKAWRRDPGKFTGLYQPVSDCWKSVDITLIPYFAFANRGESEMVVWLGMRHT